MVREIVNDIGVLEECWEDLRFPANGISIGSLTSPPDVDTDTGLLLFDGAASNETIGILAQMPHAWHEQTEIRPHVHWRKTSDAAGDVHWTLRYKWLNANETEGAWSSLIVGTESVSPGSTQKQAITSFGSIDGTGKNVSSLFLCQIGRLPGQPTDTYEADVLLYEFDIHVQIDTFGSDQEFTKTSVRAEAYDQYAIP